MHLKSEVRNCCACPECHVEKGELCNHRGKGAEKRRRNQSNHQARAILATKIDRANKTKGEYVDDDFDLIDRW